MNINYQLHRWFWNALDWIYPPVCAGCGKNGHRFCKECLAGVTVFSESHCSICGKNTPNNSFICKECQLTPYYFSDACSWAAYGGSLREAIHALKYRQDVGLGDFFAAFLVSLLAEKQWQFDLVIPVPLSRTRRKQRGYNQSELLSRPIARFFSIEHSNSALMRTKDTGEQYKRNSIERKTNLEDAFFANPAKLKEREVLLVDDIITTGATIRACSKTLLEAGAGKVMVISLAKALRNQKNQEM